MQRIRADAPLVHNISNYVVMNTTANALLAVGASPVMAHAIEEIDEMVALARAVVLNIGTLSGPWIEAMAMAGREAKRRSLPLVLDAVGAGATSLRTRVARRLLEEASPTILRGNASEIRALAFSERGTKGVDSTHDSEDTVDAARTLHRRYGCVVSVSGATDVIVSADAVAKVRNGHEMMPRVTGLGCTASALTGAFAAVNPSALHAASHAMALNGIAGEIAGERSKGPGSFQANFLDALFSLDGSEIERRLRMEVG